MEKDPNQSKRSLRKRIIFCIIEGIVIVLSVPATAIYVLLAVNKLDWSGKYFTHGYRKEFAAVIVA